MVVCMVSRDKTLTVIFLVLSGLIAEIEMHSKQNTKYQFIYSCNKVRHNRSNRAIHQSVLRSLSYAQNSMRDISKNLNESNVNFKSGLKFLRTNGTRNITKLHRILQYYGAAADLILNKEVRSMISCNETKTYDMLHVRNQITPILCDIELETNAHIPKVEIKNKLLRNMNLDCSTSLMYKSIIGRKFIALLNNVLQKLKRKRHKSKNISKSRSRNSSE